MTSWLAYIGMAMGALVLWAIGEVIVSHVLTKDQTSDPLPSRVGRLVVALLVCAVFGALMYLLLNSL